MEDKEAIKDVKRIISSLSVMAPFSYPLLMMPIIIRRDLKTWAGINGASFYVNPDMWETLEFRQKLFIAMHEWLHVVMQHPSRMTGKRQALFNKACDFVVNQMIIEEMRDKYEAPPEALYNPDFFGKNAEQVYDILIEQKEEGEEVNDDNNPSPWGCDLSPLPSDVDNGKMLDAIVKAAARSKSMKHGTLPSSYEDYINEIKKSNIPWQRILIRYAKESLKGSVTRNPFRPDPKYLVYDLFIPTEDSNNINKLVFIIDTSGSISNKDIEVACGHIQKLYSVCDKCTIITSDVKVQDIFVVKTKSIKKQIQSKKITFKGRGGTDMQAAFTAAEQMNPDLIILYSDMIFEWPKKPKKSDVIFLATEDTYINESPYGVFVKMN